jgi:hypothetical protein
MASNNFFPFLEVRPTTRDLGSYGGGIYNSKNNNPRIFLRHFLPKSTTPVLDHDK